jgi:hypothetical protein
VAGFCGRTATPQAVASDRAIAAAVLASYSASFAWRHLCDIARVHCGLAEVAGARVLIYVGTENLADLECDLQCWGTRSTAHPQLGLVDTGFFAGLEENLAALLPDLPAGVIIAGHSLGAARACLAAGLLTLAGRPPRSLVLFGCPRPGGAQLARLIRAIPATSYRNHVADQLDPITTLPPALGCLLLPLGPVVNYCNAARNASP